MSFYTSRMQDEGLMNLIGLIRRHGPPPLRLVLSAAPSASIGMVAWEYGREGVQRWDEALAAKENSIHSRMN